MHRSSLTSSLERAERAEQRAEEAVRLAQDVQRKADEQAQRAHDAEERARERADQAERQALEMRERFEALMGRLGAGVGLPPVSVVAVPEGEPEERV
jgi:predicted translin family RNA/ssDNA-binding protein